MNEEMILDKEALDIMKLRIKKLVTDNAQETEKKDKKIVDKIIKIIEEEAECSIKHQSV